MYGEKSKKRFVMETLVVVTSPTARLLRLEDSGAKEGRSVSWCLSRILVLFLRCCSNKQSPGMQRCTHGSSKTLTASWFSRSLQQLDQQLAHTTMGKAPPIIVGSREMSLKSLRPDILVPKCIKLAMQMSARTGPSDPGITFSPVWPLCYTDIQQH